MTKKTISERLAERTDTESSRVTYGRTRCHEWTGFTMKSGYGQIHQDGRTAYVHRVSWEIANGPVPYGLQVLHHCDNRKCVNVEHLFLGTLDDNMSDMVSKRRQAHGPRSSHAKLTVEDVHAIRASSAKQAELAAQFGVTQPSISMLLAGKTWQFV